MVVDSVAVGLVAVADCRHQDTVLNNAVEPNNRGDLVSAKLAYMRRL